MAEGRLLTSHLLGVDLEAKRRCVALTNTAECCFEGSASTGLIGNEGIATFLAIGRGYMTQVATAVIERSGYESPLHR